MAYCVNCGVELGEGERTCPLCSTPVILPHGAVVQTREKKLPPGRDEYPARADRQLWFWLATVVLLTPALISLTINMLVDGRLTWSLVVIGSLAAAWVLFVSPLLYHRRVFPLWIVCDILAVSGLLYLIEVYSHRTGWFRPLALPVTLMVGILLLVLYKLVEQHVLRGLQIVSGIFLGVGTLSIFLDGSIQLYLHDTLRLSWSLIVMIACAAVALIFALVQREQQLVDRLERWFHL